jgi:hypothetical protein
LAFIFSGVQSQTDKIYRKLSKKSLARSQYTMAPGYPASFVWLDRVCGLSLFALATNIAACFTQPDRRFYSISRLKRFQPVCFQKGSDSREKNLTVLEPVQAETIYPSNKLMNWKGWL